MQERDIHIIEEDIPKLFKMCRFILDNYTFNTADEYDYKLLIEDKEGIGCLNINGKLGSSHKILFSCSEDSIGLERKDFDNYDLRSKQPYIRDSVWIREIYHSIVRQYNELRRPYIIEKIIKNG